jgi:drug/metabolite transporter (DMT)-like permease
MNVHLRGLVRLAPYLFIFIWSSGYLVAKYGLPYAEPLTFLSVRYLCVIAMMLLLALGAGAPWPASPSQLFHIALAGVLMQAGYLGGVWCAIKLGMPAGVAALIVNTQPILTALFSRSIGERVAVRQWLGLVLGLAGVALVLSNKITTSGLSVDAIGLALLALASMTIGLLYQKRYCPAFDARTGQVVQFTAALVVTLPLALVFEENTVIWSTEFIAALTWSVLVLSGIGISLLFVMIRHGAATKVTSYMYLVPPVTSLMAWLLFGESFGPLALCGMLITVAAVALVVHPAPQRRAALDPVRP